MSGPSRISYLHANVKLVEMRSPEELKRSLDNPIVKVSLEEGVKIDRTNELREGITCCQRTI